MVRCSGDSTRLLWLTDDARTQRHHRPTPETWAFLQAGLLPDCRSRTELTEFALNCHCFSASTAVAFHPTIDCLLDSMRAGVVVFDPNGSLN
jgi:hypothetical protein